MSQNENTQKPKPQRQKKAKVNSENNAVLLLEKRVLALENKILNLEKQNKLVAKPIKENRLLALAQGFRSNDPVMRKHVESVMDRLMKGKTITQAGLVMLQAMLNPGGEPMGSCSPRITDGAFTQSISIDAHGVVLLVPPFSALSTLQSTTQNWSLYIFAGPWLLTAFVAIASKNASRPTKAETEMIWTQFNVGIAEYPAWTPVAGAVNFSMTRVDYTFIDPNFDVKSGLSENIQNFRIVGNGLEVYCNSPTWLDQGGVVLSQFATEQAQYLGNVTRFGVSMTNSFGTIREPASGEPHMFIPMTGSISYTLPDGTVNYLVPVGSGFKTQGSNQIALGFNVSVTTEVYSNTGEKLGTIQPGTQQTVYAVYSTSTTDPNAFVMTLRWQSNQGAILASGMVMPNEQSVSVTFENIFQVQIQIPQAENLIYWVPPSFDTSAQRQADPHSSASLFKTKGGFYMPSRFDQPVYNVNETAGQRYVHALTPGMQKSKLALGDGIDDFMDRNFMTIVQSIEGISYANYPFIKLDRYVEVVPMPGSSYSVFAADAPEADPLAIMIAREVAVQGPHAYTPDVNAVGTLFAFIVQVLTAIPAFMAQAETVTHAVAESITYVNSKLGINSK